MYKNRVIAPITLVAALLFFTAIYPTHVAAQTTGASVQTNQLIPPGQNSCQTISVSSIQPYVYDGVLESFDVTISDTSNSYVGILAQVGNTPISLDYITRWAGVPSGLRIHVDTPNTDVNGVLPVTVTLLSSPSGEPTCITTISFDVVGSGATTSYTVPAATAQTTQPVTVAPAQADTSPVTTTAPAQQAQTGSVATGGKQATSTAISGSTTTIVGASVTSAANTKIFGSICSGSNAYRLWVILLVIYILIVGIVVFAEPWFLEESVLGSTAAILVPLILLLGFWYFSEACRAASWIPVLACVIAIVGLFLAFREYETPILLPAPSGQ